MTGKLTTHVLNTAIGQPATGIKIELWQITETGESLLATAITNRDGRTEKPILSAQTMTIGIYELRFLVGEYFAKTQTNLPNPPFLDQVPIRFGISDTTAHYHVPLLVSPWSYSTYRGS